MFRRFLFAAGTLALVWALGMPGQVHAQHSRGGMPHGMPPGMQRGMQPRFTPGVRGPMMNRPFAPRSFDRFEDRFERRFPFGRFDRIEDLLENRLRFGFLPHFVGGFPGLSPFGFPGLFPFGF